MKHEYVDSYLPAAERLHNQIDNHFGPQLKGTTPVDPSMPHGQEAAATPAKWILTPYAYNLEYQVAGLEDNKDLLGAVENVGQVVAVSRRTTVGGKSVEITNPAILQGASADGSGVQVMLLLDPLKRHDPSISDVQDILLRTFARLDAPGTGSESVDKQRGGIATEPGHTYLGLRTVTDPQLVKALEAGQHPVHDWAARGIAETVSQRHSSVPGMFDMRLSDGRMRMVAPLRKVLRSGDGSTVIMHPAYKAEERYGVVLPAERIALAVGIKAAESTTLRCRSQLETDMMRSLEAINRF